MYYVLYYVTYASSIFKSICYYRLYFDCPENNDEVVDDGKLKNEIDRLKLEVMEFSILYCF